MSYWARARREAGRQLAEVRRRLPDARDALAEAQAALEQAGARLGAAGERVAEAGRALEQAQAEQDQARRERYQARRARDRAAARVGRLQRREAELTGRIGQLPPLRPARAQGGSRGRTGGAGGLCSWTVRAVNSRLFGGPVQLIRFAPASGGEPRPGVLAAGQVVPLRQVQSMAALLALPVPEIRERCEAPGADPLPLAGVTLLAPVDGTTEVWAAGVTYERSRAARVIESEHEADIYERVYDAARPELFFKSAAWRVAGPGGPVSVRADSGVDVPEPELAVVLNAGAEIVGYTICNDMSSRSIEGENPLYLPQAKIYLGGCAAGPGIRPAWEVPDPYALTIEMTIRRDGAVAWQGQASTAGLRRKIPELASFLFAEDDFPGGVVLSTGTSLVPDLPFTLQPGDEVSIRITGIGELANPVVRGKAAVAAAR